MILFFSFQMRHVGDIRYDQTLYSQTNPWIIVLHQGKKPFPLASAPDIAFANPFDGIVDCHTHISRQPSRRFVLFALGDNLLTWLENNLPVPKNFDQVTGFGVPRKEQDYFLAHTRRFWPNRGVLTAERFERNLLERGLDHIEDMIDESEEDRGVVGLLERDRKKLWDALEQYTGRRLRRAEEEEHRLGVQASS